MANDEYLPPANETEAQLVKIEATWTTLHPENWAPEILEIDGLLRSGALTPDYKRRAARLKATVSLAYTDYIA